MPMILRITSAVLALLVIVVAYQLWVQQNVGTDNDGSEATTPPESTEEQWSVYTDEGYPFTFRYPPDAETTIENERVKVTYVGPDNTMGSEITDGFTIFLGLRRATGDTAAVAQKWLEEELIHGSLVEEVQAVNRSGWAGHQFTVETALGTEATHLVLETDYNQFLTFSYTSIDPHERGYITMVDHILETLDFE